MLGNQVTTTCNTRMVDRLLLQLHGLADKPPTCDSLSLTSTPGPAADARVLVVAAVAALCPDLCSDPGPFLPPPRPAVLRSVLLPLLGRMPTVGCVITVAVGGKVPTPDITLAFGPSL
jgi:hypothetical protein